MILNKPSIFINRLCVYKDGYIVLDIPFHKGVNIVRGHNSSGKTTVLDFIAYTLGAEFIPFKKEALLCNYALLEISLNGLPITLRRDVSNKAQNGLYFFHGVMEEAAVAPFTAWELYPFRRSQNKLSFTQNILVSLGLPEAQGDGASNLTMHQFLRVIYADQPSLHSPIFRIDSFDSALTRETVGNYISGVYDDKLYSTQLAKREIEKEIQQADAELKNIFNVLSKSQQNANIEVFGHMILEAESRQNVLQEEFARLKNERSVTPTKRKDGTEDLIRIKLDAAKQAFNYSLGKITRYELEIEDSRLFIDELKSRLASLDDSEAARGHFGALAFNFCPCCLSEVKQSPSIVGLCSLCKSPISESSGNAQILRMKNELRVQLKESEILMAKRAIEVTELRQSIPWQKQELIAMERRFNETSSNWSSEIEEAIETAAREIGRLDQEIKGLYENQKLASAIRTLQDRRRELIDNLQEMHGIIESLEMAQEGRKQEVNCEIASTLSRLLKLDFYRQEEFRTASNINFSFIDNQIIVDGSTKFSESSTVVLRHLFHLAILSASTRIPSMRFPRLLMLDGIEDGGLELERAYGLQEIMVNECASFTCDYQLIFATSQISPSLNKDDFVVGREFTEKRRSIDIR